MLYKELFRTIARNLGKRMIVVPLPNTLLLIAGKMFDLASRLFGLSLPLSAATAKSGMHTLFYSSEKATRELGFDPGDPADAIRRCIAWLESKQWFERIPGTAKPSRRKAISVPRAAE